jgi:hypothetical protein
MTRIEAATTCQLREQATNDWEQLLADWRQLMAAPELIESPAVTLQKAQALLGRIEPFWDWARAATRSAGEIGARHEAVSEIGELINWCKRRMVSIRSAGSRKAGVTQASIPKFKQTAPSGFMRPVGLEGDEFVAYFIDVFVKALVLPVRERVSTIAGLFDLLTTAELVRLDEILEGEKLMRTTGGAPDGLEVRQ